MRGGSGALGRDQFVDLFAEVLQHEILIGGRLAVVDFLGPLLERQLDAERLVDGEGDVEEIQAVDLEIVDGVTFRLNVFTRNVASFRNDSATLSNVVDIRPALFGHGKDGRRPRSGACKPARAGPP